MKKFLLIIIAIIIVLTMTACYEEAEASFNKQIFDLTWSFEEAIIFLPDGSSIEGPIESWTDFEASDMIQVKIDGKQYLTHSSNVILISE